MGPVVVGVAAILIIVAAAALSRRTGVASPLIVLAVGIGVGYIPGVPTIRIGPEWILGAVLPPLLYASAVSMPVLNLRRNIKPIAGLSVLLVVVTTLVSGLVLWALLPALGLAGAIALGAVISPTDVVAATSLARKLGLPGRLVAVLEGEGLVNDASSLVLLRSALAATAGTVSVWQVAGNFLYAVAFALLVGFVVGIVTVAVRSRFRDPVTSTAISFAVPFLAYLPAEQIGASGVLAVVVAGIVTGHRATGRLEASQRISDHTNWRTIQFVLEHGVFLLMGFEFHTLIRDVRGEHELVTAVLLGLLMSAVVIAVRFLFVFPQLALLGRGERQTRRRVEPRLRWARRFVSTDTAEIPQRLAKRRPLFRKRLRRVEADLDFYDREGFGWRGSLVISASGMRGVVTLAAAQTIPADTPYRSTLILIALLVAVVTLLGLGPVLPVVIRAVGLSRDDDEEQRVEVVELLSRVNDAALAVLDDEDQLVIGEERADPEVVEALRRSRRSRGDAARPLSDEAARDRRTQFLILQQRMREAAQRELLDARAVGAYDADSIAAAQDVFDMEGYRLDQIRGEG